VQQIVLADHPIAISYEVGKQIKSHWFEFDQLRPTDQFAALGIEPAVAKRQHHLSPRLFCRSASCDEIISLS
jgi:hypothetical protein